MKNYKPLLSILCLILIYSCSQVPKFLLPDPWGVHYNSRDFEKQLEDFRYYHDDSTSQYVKTMIDYVKKSEELSYNLNHHGYNKYSDLREKYESELSEIQRIKEQKLKQQNNDRKYFNYLKKNGVRLKEKSFGKTLRKSDYNNWIIEVDKFLIEELIFNEINKVWKCSGRSDPSPSTELSSRRRLGFNDYVVSLRDVKIDGVCTYVGWKSNQNKKLIDGAIKLYKRLEEFLLKKNTFEKYGFEVYIQLQETSYGLKSDYETINLIFKSLEEKPIPSEEYWLDNYVK